MMSPEYPASCWNVVENVGHFVYIFCCIYNIKLLYYIYYIIKLLYYKVIILYILYILNNEKKKLLKNLLKKKLSWIEKMS